MWPEAYSGHIFDAMQRQILTKPKTWPAANFPMGVKDARAYPLRKDRARSRPDKVAFLLSLRAQWQAAQAMLRIKIFARQFWVALLDRFLAWARTQTAHIDVSN